ncbi:MAG: carbohydrate ABC transporter substrate-binding protein [Clostridia bacterium]|nr:carbohydrate ABC transporter substrate-binding protein [Clostridia bacterium]
MKITVRYFLSILLVLSFFIVMISCDSGAENNIKVGTELIPLDMDRFDSFLLLSDFSSEFGYVAVDASSVYILDETFEVKISFPHSFSSFGIYPGEDLSFYITEVGSSDIKKYVIDPDNGITLSETISFNAAENLRIISFFEIDGINYTVVFNTENQSYSIWSDDKNFIGENMYFIPCRFSPDVEEILVPESSVSDECFITRYDSDLNRISSFPLTYPVNSCCWIVSENIVVYDSVFSGQTCLIEADLSSGEENIIVKFKDSVSVHSVVQDNDGYSVFACSLSENILIKTNGKYGAIVDMQENSVNYSPVYDEVRSEEPFTIAIAYSDYESYINPKAEAQFKQWYPNSEIKHLDIGDTDQNDTYSSTLRQKLLANDSDFDLFFILSPSSIPSIIKNEAYKSLDDMTQTIRGFDNYYEQIKNLCIYDGKFFGVPVRIRASAMGVNHELVEKYTIDYDFANDPLTYEELPDFLEKYCKDYDGDGIIDVYFDQYLTLDGNINSFIPTNEIYENSRFNWLHDDVSYDSLYVEMLDYQENEMLQYIKPYDGNNDNVLFFTPTLSNLSVFSDDTSLYTFPITLSENDGAFLFNVYFLCANRYSKLDQKYIDDYLSLYTDPAFATTDYVEAFRPPYIEGKDLSEYNLALYEKLLEKARIKCAPLKDFKSEWNKYRIEFEDQYRNGAISSDKLVDALNNKLKFLING